ncbi:hypothetical protein [Frigidibacter sp.]|uniref:hypothetical protein n=1 Tax=Frigidibacter sp. TaxID=2586418 RepID=UPI00273428D9|nr:hypothetical protein [Frigidibacter sp.]MDP3340294.1 hypothetical protein [Frigidibacter sp.]
MIYFDIIETWEESFEEIVVSLIGRSNVEELQKTAFDYIEDAGNFVTSFADIRSVSSEICSWLKDREVCVFHGTRLLPAELESIKNTGLRPLIARDRNDRLTEIFKSHKDWLVLKDSLHEITTIVGPQERDGRRENQVHFSLSRSGLIKGFNHYLTHGSEFDQNVASRLFPDGSGLKLLQSATAPYLVHVRMSGGDLVKGAHPHFSYQDVVDMGEVPGLGATFLNAWAFKKSKPNFDISKLRTDCCMMQEHPTPREKILRIEALRGRGL